MDSKLTDLLAIRLIWEGALLAHSTDPTDGWADVVRDHARPLEPSADQALDAIQQDAAKRASQRGLIAQVTAPSATSVRLALQAVFCIDVRSEVFLRALERVAPDAETLSFKEFFGLRLAYRQQGGDLAEAHLPVLLTPSLAATMSRQPRGSWPALPGPGAGFGRRRVPCMG